MKPRKRLEQIARSIGLLEPEQPSGYAYRAPAPDLGRRVTDEEAFESFQRQWRERNDPRPFLITGLEVSPDQQPPSTKAIIAAQAHDAQALARVQLPLANQAARERAAWGRAIEALPRSMRQMIEQTQSAVLAVDAQIADRQQRIEALSMGNSDVWITRRAQLLADLDGLGALRVECAADYRRICERAAEQLDQILFQQSAEAEQEIEDAELHYQALLARSKAELGQLQSERRAIGAVRAATDDPRTVEQHLGLVVTPEAARYGAAERLKERAPVTMALLTGVKQ